MITTILSIPATTPNPAAPTPADDPLDVEIEIRKDPNVNATNIIMTVDNVEYTIDVDNFKEAARKLDIVLA